MRTETFQKIQTEGLSALSHSEMEEAVSLAESILRADYWRDVRGIVEDVREAVERGEVTDEDGAREYVEQTVDGCGRVIYTGQALDGLRWSDNDEAWTELGAFPMQGDSPNWSAAMYFALLQDVWDELGDLADLFDAEDAEDADDDA